MKPSVKITLFGAALVALILTQVCEARAELPPEPWHCASQEQCFALLVDDGVLVIREGVEKGLVQNMGMGDGRISISNGIIVVTRSNSSNVYLYDIANSTQCNINVTESCKAGEVIFVNGDWYAHAICPSGQIKRIPMDCSTYASFSSNRGGPREMTQDGTNIYISYDSSSEIGELLPNSAVPLFTTNLSYVRSIVYSSGTIYLEGYDGTDYGIFTMPTPLSYSDTATLLHTLPQETEFMTGSESYLAISSVNAGYIVSYSNPSGMVTVPISEARENAISPATAGEPTRIYFIEAGVMPAVRMRVFDETGTELGFSPIDTPAWDVAYIAPTLPPVCNNGLVDPGETCDSTDFDGIDCTDYGFDGGPLSCSATCDQIFTSGCWRCGDGTRNPGESCDGTDMGGGTCQDGGYESGDISCDFDCTFNYSLCYTCGNSILEDVEQCEGAELNGADCITQGFVSGTLACGTDCMYDVSECSACGDNIANYSETCDGTDVPGMICQTMGLGYTGGTLGCNSSCDGYDDSNCWTCGDGTINLNEECDGTNLGTLTCDDLGFGPGGTLSCFENCTLNVTLCDAPPAEFCGNGITDTGEECDDGNRSNNDDCSETCHIIPPTCGVGGVDAGETCDGTDLNGETCVSLGYEAGVLYCGDDCQLRTDGCYFLNAPQTISLTLDAEPEPGELDESLQSQYDSLKSTLTPRCISQEVNGDLVFTTVEGSYCAIRAVDHSSSETKKMFSFIFLPENPLDEEQPVLRFYQSGTIAQNFGGNITAYKGLQVKTVLLQDRLYQVTQERIAAMGMKFLSVHPKTNMPGRWLALNIGIGSTSMCTDDAGENCAKLVPEQGQVIVNLEALEDINSFNWNPKSGSGCSCQAGSNSSNSLPLLFVLTSMFLFWNRRRRKN